MSNILVVAAHPDDEVLGCGGTIAKHINQGDEVHVLILAEGITSRDTKRDRSNSKEELSELGIAAHKAHKIMGTSSLKLLDYADNRMDSVDLLDIVKTVEEEVKEKKPKIVYTHHHGDLNIDHQITHQAVLTACRPYPDQSVKKIYCFEVPSSTEWQSPSVDTVFIPNTFVDISVTLSLKLDALRAYESEMRPWPHVRSIKAVENLVCWHGASMGMEAAEAFVLVRELI